ncbi:glycosyltransferase [Micromonospora sp. KC606]|uniref:glycosyltransferase family 2 protein n=1 Tax=Micromonospora sp. KC606 TaxID=2530379 RepID=UPI001050356A|nr:cellulose synthase catalytic subunit [Micromonospora sp. KC606]TDC81475.1 glycosyltransferase [Micromonospora sp. KC606]
MTATAAAESEASYRVEYERLPEPWWMPWLFWAWVAIAVPYVPWRIYATNWANWSGPLLLACELFAIMLAALFLGTAQQIHMPIHRPTDLTRWVVDCLIPTHLEPADVIECTVIAALKVHGIREVIVLANFERPEVRAVCERLRVRYLPRGSNEHAKAGNLNVGLAYSDAPFLLHLDADYIVRPEILQRVMGWFDDPTMAFVQGPQTYYNHDSFVFRTFRRIRAGWSEQTMFYQVIQPSKNRWNAACFVGSCAVMRRAALDSIGGFATGTVTEDIHTSLRIHAKGWSSVYTNEPVAYGMEAPSFKEFYTQRRRWAAGAATIGFRSPDSPLRIPGLTLMQRINYFNSIITHAQGPLRAAFTFAPMLCLLTFAVPIHINVVWFIVVSLGFAAYSAALGWIYSRGAMHFIHNEAYLYANHPGMSMGMAGLFKVRREFVSSRKTGKRTERTWVRWYLWLLATAMLATGGYGLTLILAGNRSTAVLLATVFIVMNEFFLLWFLIPLIRYEHRGRHAPPPEYHTLTGEDRYRYVMRFYDGRYVMPSGIMVDRPVKTSRIRPGRRPGWVETRVFTYEPGKSGSLEPETATAT